MDPVALVIIAVIIVVFPVGYYFGRLRGIEIGQRKAPIEFAKAKPPATSQKMDRVPPPEPQSARVSRARSYRSPRR